MTRGGATRWFAAAAGAALLALVGVLAVALARGIGGTSEGEARATFERAPEFTGAEFDGSAFDLAAHADGPVFVYFWASWCDPCRQEAPIIEALWPEYRDRGFTFVGVNMWDAESDARRFLQEFPTSFPMVRDAEGSIYVDYGVQALPTAFFLSSGLQVQTRYDGRLDEDGLRRLLDALVSEPATARWP